MKEVKKENAQSTGKHLTLKELNSTNYLAMTEVDLKQLMMKELEKAEGYLKKTCEHLKKLERYASALGESINVGEPL